jgi:hypothetical protein
MTRASENTIAPTAATLQAEVERARADYLAVSKNAHMYASTEEYERAEAAAWERMEAAITLAGVAT